MIEQPNQGASGRSGEARRMTDLASSLREAAETLIYEEAAQIEHEVQLLLAEVERASVEECRRGGFAHRLLDLLERRGEVALNALIIAGRVVGSAGSVTEEADHGETMDRRRVVSW